MYDYVEMADDDLINLLKADDHHAFTVIYNRYWDKLFAIGYRRINNQSDAEEIVQDVFFTLWKRRKVLDLRHGLSTYLAAAVKYQVINRLAKEEVRRKHLDRAAETTCIRESSTEIWLSEKEAMLKLEQCILQLPEKCRLVFELSRKEGKSTKQIAEQLRISEKTAEAHITKALSSIRNSLHITMPFLIILMEK